MKSLLDNDQFFHSNSITGLPYQKKKKISVMDYLLIDHLKCLTVIFPHVKLVSDTVCWFHLMVLKPKDHMLHQYKSKALAGAWRSDGSARSDHSSLKLCVSEQLWLHDVHSGSLRHPCTKIKLILAATRGEGLRQLLKAEPPASRRLHDVSHSLTVSVSVSTKLALRNALRYFPPRHHATLAPEFAQELRQYGHIYMYRFCPTLAMR